MPHEAKSPTDKMGKVGGLGTDWLYQLVEPDRGACGSQRSVGSVSQPNFLKFRVDIGR